MIAKMPQEARFCKLIYVSVFIKRGTKALKFFNFALNDSAEAFVLRLRK
jgi:hypothetical protein